MFYREIHLDQSFIKFSLFQLLIYQDWRVICVLTTWWQCKNDHFCSSRYDYAAIKLRLHIQGWTLERLNGDVLYSKTDRCVTLTVLVIPRNRKQKHIIWISSCQKVNYSTQ